MIAFGVGDVFLIPPSTASNPTPIRVAALQEVTVDISFETKTLYGNKQFPIAVGRGKGTISGKAKVGNFQGALIQSLLTGATSTANQVLWLKEKAATVASGKFTATKSTVWGRDLGAYDDSSNPLVNVATTAGLVAGQYYVTATGVYTFYSASANSNYAVQYDYSDTTGGSTTTSYTNQLMGQGSTYMLELFNTNPDSSTFGLRFPAVVFPKLAIAFRTDDFTVPDLDFSAFADTNDNVFTYFTSKA